MVKSRGNVIQAIQVSIGFGQDKNSTYTIRETDLLFESNKDCIATLVHESVATPVVFHVSKYKVYALPPGSLTLHCTEKFNVGA